MKFHAREGCVNHHETPELGDKVDELWFDLATWSQKTFGADENRGPIGPLKHLKKEANEAILVAREMREVGLLAGCEDMETEMADCLLLVFDAARRGGVSLMELINAARRKLATNKSRTYPAPTGDEVSEHVRGGGDVA